MESLPKKPIHFTTDSKGKPHLHIWEYGGSPSNPQAGIFSAPIRPNIHFLATLNFPYLSKLMNDPLRHNSSWPPAPTKIPSNIPKFEGKVGDDQGSHVTTFHLW